MGNSGLYDGGREHFGRADYGYCNLVRARRNFHNSYVEHDIDVGKG